MTEAGPGAATPCHQVMVGAGLGLSCYFNTTHAAAESPGRRGEQFKEALCKWEVFSGCIVISEYPDYDV